MEKLEVDPWGTGDTCDPPIEGLRRVHFWNDAYRLVWLVVPDVRRVDVIAVGRKVPTFYDEVRQRFDALRARLLGTLV